jgi:ribose transport system permease protein
MVSYWNVPPFIISMASMNIAKGLASVFTKTNTVSWPQADQAGGWFRNLLRVGNFPVGLVLFLIAAILCAIILNNTRAGRYILGLGSNKEAVRLSGVNTKRWQMTAYVICGILTGIAAIFFAAAYTTVQPGYGDQYNNEVIAGCVMGGTSMIGGLASISGTFIGAIIISMIQEGILAMKFAKDVQLIITAVIVAAAVFIDV